MTGSRSKKPAQYCDVCSKSHGHLLFSLPPFQDLLGIWEPSEQISPSVPHPPQNCDWYQTLQIFFYILFIIIILFFVLGFAFRETAND